MATPAIVVPVYDEVRRHPLYIVKRRAGAPAPGESR
jgi:hypothetical protein